MNKVKRDSGQIALMLVLIMTVIGTAAISLAGRTVVETRVQEVNVDSSQAMLAAESGLERALAPTPVLSGTVGTNATFNVTDQTTGTSYAIVGPFANGEIWEINLSGFSGQLNLYWDSAPTSGGARGVYVSGVHSTGILDNAYAPSGFGNGFTTPDTGSYSLGGRNFTYRRLAVPYTAGSTVMRVMMLGGDTILGFQAGTGTLTAQVRQLTSVGTVARGNESIKQGLGYYESVTDQVPGVFDFALYSGGDIVQNSL